MKIAYIVPKLSNKGPILVVKELVLQMIKNNHECTVYYLDEGKEINLECKCIKINLYTKIDLNKFDVVHSHGLRPDAYVFLHRKKKTKTIYISTLHNFIFDDLSYEYNKIISRVFGYLWIKLLSRHDKIITLTKNALNYYSQWIDVSKLYYVYNTRSFNDIKYPTKEQTDKIKNFKGNDILIGTNAALTHRKGIDQIIKSLRLIKGYKLIIVGTGKDEDSLRNLVKAEKAEEKVMFWGYEKDAYKFLPYYDIYALPSRSEGFALTILEAAFFKKNLICSKIDFFSEILSDNEVFFFEPENIESLAEAINKANSVYKGETLYKKYLSEYSPECFYSKHIKIYITKK